MTGEKIDYRAKKPLDLLVNCLQRILWREAMNTFLTGNAELEFTKEMIELYIKALKKGPIKHAGLISIKNL